MAETGASLEEAFLPHPTDQIEAHPFAPEDLQVTIQQPVAIMGIFPERIRLPVDIGHTEQVVGRAGTTVQGFDPGTTPTKAFFQPDPVGQQVGIRQGGEARAPDGLLVLPLPDGHAIDICLAVDTTLLFQQAPCHFGDQGPCKQAAEFDSQGGLAGRFGSGDHNQGGMVAHSPKIQG